MAGDYKLRRTSSEGSHAIKFLLQSTSKIAAARTTKIEPEKENSESSELPQNLKGVSSRALNFLKGIETSDSHIPGICGPCKLFTVWENDYSIKILGSRNAIEKEELRRKNLPMFTIHPFSRAKQYWDSILLITLLLNSFLLPVSIAFYTKIPIAWLISNIVSDLILLIDIVFIFWSGVVTEDNFIFLNLKEIRWNYVWSWLIVDIASIIPFDYIEYILYLIPHDYSSNGNLDLSNYYQPLFKLLSIIKIIRVLKMIRLLAKWKERLFTSWTIPTLADLVIGVLVLCHWNGCIQFLVVSLDGFPPDSWVAINNLQNATVGTQYTFSIFKALSHMLCIGYGQGPPRSTTDIWVTIISMLIGTIFYGMFFGHMTSFIYSSTISNRKYVEQLSLVEEYMKYHKIPEKLKLRVRDYFYHKYHGRLFNEKAMLAELSHILKEEINKFHYQDVIKLVPIFKDVDQSFINAITSKFTFEVFLEGDYIISYNSVGNTMYFIQHGEAQVVNSKGETIKTLVDGDYFGEISLLLNERRQGNVKATTVCFVFCLERDDLNTVLNRFPNLRASLEVRARERLYELYRSEDRSPDHFHSLFSERLTESETIMSESMDDTELESTESFLYNYAADISSKQLPVLEITPSVLHVPKTTDIQGPISRVT